MGDCRAADPQAYAVTIAGTGDALLDQALADSSNLIALRDKAPAGPYALIARAREDAERFVAALRSFGYYKARLDIRIGGRPLDDPDLPQRLADAAADPPVAVSVAAQRGPLFHLRRITIRGSVPALASAKLGLQPGDVALAPEVLAARQRLLEALRRQGHALARVDEPVATPIPQADALDIIYPVEAGPIVNLGPIALKGLTHMNEDFLRRRLSVRPGQRFDPAEIDKARSDLASIGVFSSVRVQWADRLDGSGRLPIELDVTERPLRAVNLNGAYSTDLGASLAASWQHRNLFGNAEQLTLTGGVTQLGGNSTRGIGYQIAAGFLKPDFLLRNQSLQANLGAIRQNLDAYDREAQYADLTVNRKLGRHWTVGLGLSAEQEHIRQQNIGSDFTLIGLPLTVKFDNSNHLLDPTRGIRADASLTPMYPVAGPSGEPFVLMQLSGSTYLDLGEPGRSVLALRGLIGDVEGASAGQLPPDKRFYAGGSATVRGYAYQSIGPQFPDHKPRGGTALAAGSAEFRQRILDQYGAVLFVDAGQVSADGPPLSEPWRVGAGVGARYYTGIGPIRLDVAVPLNRQAGGDSFELYIGLGQAF